MPCEYCGGFNDGQYGSGRFCRSVCARAFATSRNREEINKKRAATWKLRVRSPEEIANHIAGVRRGGLKNSERALKVLLSSEFETLSRDMKKKRLIHEGAGRCKICGTSEWNGKPLPLRLDHIDGNRQDNRSGNLRVICGNCDSQLDTFCGRNRRRYIQT